MCGDNNPLCNRSLDHKCSHFLQCQNAQCAQFKHNQWEAGWNACQESTDPCPTADDHDFGGCQIAFAWKVWQPQFTCKPIITIRTVDGILTTNCECEKVCMPTQMGVA